MTRYLPIPVLLAFAICALGCSDTVRNESSRTSQAPTTVATAEKQAAEAVDPPTATTPDGSRPDASTAGRGTPESATGKRVPRLELRASDADKDKTLALLGKQKAAALGKNPILMCATGNDKVAVFDSALEGRNNSFMLMDRDMVINAGRTRAALDDTLEGLDGLVLEPGEWAIKVEGTFTKQAGRVSSGDAPPGARDDAPAIGSKDTASKSKADSGQPASKPAISAAQAAETAGDRPSMFRLTIGEMEKMSLGNFAAAIAKGLRRTQMADVLSGKRAAQTGDEQLESLDFIGSCEVLAQGLLQLKNHWQELRSEGTTGALTTILQFTNKSKAVISRRKPGATAAGEIERLAFVGDLSVAVVFVRGSVARVSGQTMQLGSKELPLFVLQKDSVTQQENGEKLTLASGTWILNFDEGAAFEVLTEEK